MFTYFPLSLNNAQSECKTVLDPSSVITKLPSPAVGVMGSISELTRNSLPLDKPHATRCSVGKCSKHCTDTLPLVSGSNV